MQNKPAMQSFVLDLMKTSLPLYLYYHDTDHTLYVLDKAIEIGKQENCTQEEIDLLKVAALWHDVGHINIYVNHEEESCELAQKYLPDFGYSKAQIDKICGIIMATKIPQSPHNKLEEIIADADLYYLGTEDAHEYSGNLFKELQYLNPGLTEIEWNKMQISFLKNHHYFTSYCKEKLGATKAAYLESLLAVTS